MASSLSFVGLLLTLVGACLLFFWGLPKKKMGNVVLWGTTAMKFEDQNERDVPDVEWQAAANTFLKRAQNLNRTGFALVAIGTLMQMLAILC